MRGYPSLPPSSFSHSHSLTHALALPHHHHHHPYLSHSPSLNSSTVYLSTRSTRNRSTYLLAPHYFTPLSAYLLALHSMLFSPTLIKKFPSFLLSPPCCYLPQSNTAGNGGVMLPLNFICTTFSYILPTSSPNTHTHGSLSTKFLFFYKSRPSATHTLSPSLFYIPFT